ncbi:MAG: TIGR03000 domain-containing protein [Gemmataceae bacterium]
MRISVFSSLLVGAMFLAGPSDAWAQGRGHGGSRGYRSGGYGNSWNTWSYPHGYYYGNNYWSSPGYYGPSLWYGGSYGIYGRSYYAPGYYGTLPSYSYVDPNPGNAPVITQATYTEADQSRQGLLTVYLPNPDAQLWMQGYEMSMRGDVRTFYSPPLEPNTNYTYTLKARWLVNGNPVEQQRNVSIQAGQQVTADFRVSPNETPMPKPETSPRK